MRVPIETRVKRLLNVFRDAKFERLATYPPRTINADNGTQDSGWNKKQVSPNRKLFYRRPYIEKGHDSKGSIYVLWDRPIWRTRCQMPTPRDVGQHRKYIIIVDKPEVILCTVTQMKRRNSNNWRCFEANFDVNSTRTSVDNEYIQGTDYKIW